MSWYGVLFVVFINTNCCYFYMKLLDNYYSAVGQLGDVVQDKKFGHKSLAIKIECRYSG